MDDEKMAMVVVHEKDEDENQNQNGQENKKEDRNKEVKKSKQDKGVKGELKQEERTCTAMIPQLGASGSGVPN